MLCLFGVHRSVADTAATWLSATNGDWTDATHWSTNPFFPNNGTNGVNYSSVISATGSAYTITLSSSITVDAITLSSTDATFTQTAGTLTAASGLSVTAGNFQLFGGTITGSPISLSGAGSITLGSGGTIKGGAVTAAGGAGLSVRASDSGTLDAVSLGANLSIANAAVLNVKNGLTLSNNAKLALASVGNSTQLTFGAGAQTLGGTGEVFFGGTAGSNFLSAQGDGTAAGAAALTIGSGITVHGMQSGTIQAVSSFDSILNQGTIFADTTGTTITLAGNWSGLGTIKAQNGGVVALTGTLKNTGQTLDFAAGFGSLTLGGGGTIKGGTVTASGGSAGLLVRANDGGTLDGVALGATVSLANGAVLNVKNGLTLSGNTSVTLASNGSASSLVFGVGPQTLGGTGQVLFGGTAGSNFVSAQGDGTAAGAAALTLGAGMTVHGTQSGTIQAVSSFDSILNQGTIFADTAGTTISLAGSWTGLGTIKTLNGGVVALTGTLKNTGQTLDFAPGFGSLTLGGGGTIKGGVVTASGGSAGLLVRANDGGTLDGVALGATLSLANGAVLNVKNGLTLSGNTSVTLASNGSASSLVFGAGAQTLGGTGQVLFGGAAGSNFVSAQGDGTAAGAAALTIGSGITVHGTQSGTIQAVSSFDTVLNQGTILAETTGTTISLAGNWSRLGTLKTLNGGVVALTGTLNNAGQTLDFATGFGSLTLGGGGTIKGGAVTASGGSAGLLVRANDGGTLDGVTLGATLSLANGAVLNVKNGLTLSGNTSVTLASNGSASSLVFGVGAQTLGGTGQVLFGGAAGSNFLSAQGDGTAGGAATLTIGSGITVHGTQSGTLQAVSGFDSILNQGTILAETTGTTISLAGNWTGLGTIKTQNGGVVALTGTLRNTGQTLDFATGFGSLTLGGGGTIKAGAVTASGGSAGLLVRANDSGTLDGVSLGATLSVANSAVLNVKNGLTLSNNALITLAGNGGATRLTFGSGSQTLGGTGVVLFGGTVGSDFLNAQGDGTAGGAATLTIGAGITVHATQSGTLQGMGAFDSILNQGTILADTAGATVSLAGNWTGLGTLQAQGGGAIVLTGTLTNTGHTLDFPVGTGPLVLGGGGTIRGGTVTNSGGGPGLVMRINDSGTLDGVGLGANLAVANGATLNVRNGLTLSNNARVTLASDGSVSRLTFGSGAQTIGGTGEISFGGTAGTNSLLAQGDGTAGGAATLTIGAGVTVHGTQSGTIQAVSSFDSILNQGTIFADTSGTTITLAGNWAGLGTIKTQNGGVIALTGTLMNAGKTLDFPAGSGPLALSGGGTIKGGTVLNSGGGDGLVISSYDSGTLDGVSLGANLTIANSATLNVKNSLTLSNSARITLAHNSTSGGSVLAFRSGTQTLSGTGEVFFGGTTGTNYLYALGDGTLGGAATLTIGPGITVHGTHDGTIQPVYSFDSIINQGTILADTAGATISLAGNWSGLGTIKIQNGGVIALTGTLLNAGKTLDFPTGTGSLDLSGGGTIKGGAVTASGGGVALLLRAGDSGTLDGVSLGANASIANFATLNVQNGLTLSNSAKVTLATDGSGSRLVFGSGAQSLGGSGEVVFTGSAANNFLNAQGDNTAAGAATLTIGAGVTVHGSQGGTIQSIYSFDSFVNQGTISADSAGQTITLAGHWSNSGTLTALNGGILSLGGNFTNVGTFNSNGGTILISGTLDNTGRTLSLTGAGASLGLGGGGTIRNGTVTASGGAVLAVQNLDNGALDGVNLAANVSLANGATLNVKNGLTLSNSSRVTLASVGSTTAFTFGSGAQTLAGTGEVFFSGISRNNFLSAKGDGTAAGAATLTIGSGITVHGSQGGSVQAMYSFDSIVNQGAISADTAGQTITLAGQWSNTGSLNATNGGILNLGGNFTSLGTYNSNGGTILISGTLDNTGRTLSLTAASGSLGLSGGGTIKNGTVNASGGAGLTVNGFLNNGVLDGVSLGANVLITDGAKLNVKHGLALSSNAQITLGGTGSPTQVTFGAGAQSLTGTGEVLFGGTVGGSSLNAQGDGTAMGAAILTIGPGITVHGSQSGTIQGYYSADSFVNQGTISADTAGQTITLAGHWSNSGMLNTANGGTLSLGGNFTALGAYNATGGTIIISGTLDNTGRTLSLTPASGSLALGNGGTIKGGMVTGTGGAGLSIALTGSGSGTLDGVNLGARILVGGGAALFVKNGLTLSNAARITLANDNSFAPLISFGSGAQTFGGTGELLFSGSFSGVELRAQGDGTAAGASNLTIGSGITIHGTQDASVRAVYSFDSIVNQGTISADTAGKTITLSGNWSNLGTLNALNGGTLNLGGSFNSLGTYSSTGGSILVSGTLDNTSRTLGLTAAAGSLGLAGGTIRGGTVTATGGAALSIGSANTGTLDGVTLDTNLAIASFAVLNVQNGLTLSHNAAITLSGAGAVSQLIFGPGAQTLGGMGDVLFGGTSGLNFVFALGNGTAAGAAALTIGPGVNFHGMKDGTIEAVNSFDSILNQGKISADGITVSMIGKFANSGTLEAVNGGTLNAPTGYTQNAGVTRLDHGSITGNGIISIASGRLEGSGTISGGVLNAGTIAPGVASGSIIGSLSILGDLTLAPTSDLQIDIGGLVQSTGYDSLTEGGSARLTLQGTLSISLAGNFLSLSKLDSFTILSSNQAIDGMFSNVVNGRVTDTSGVESFTVEVLGDKVILTDPILQTPQLTIAVGSRPAAAALNPVTNRIYVANAGDGVTRGSITVLDGSTNAASTIAADIGPVALAVNPVTDRIYVANLGDGRKASVVTVIDGAMGTSKSVVVGVSAQAVAVNPITNRIYVANREAAGGPGSVSVIDGATRTVLATIPAGAAPSALAVNPVTNKIYVANAGSGNVTVIDGASNLTTTVLAGTDPVAVAVNPVTNRIYVANEGDGTNAGMVTEIDGVTNATTTIVAQVSPVAVTVNPVANKIYVANGGSGTVTIIDGTTRALSTVLTGDGPVALAVNAATNRIYVANGGSGTFTTIDGATNGVTIAQAGVAPSALAVNPLTDRVYVVNSGSNDVTVQNGSENLTSTVSTGVMPVAVAVIPGVKKACVANAGAGSGPGTVTVIDTLSNTSTTVAVGKRPDAMAVDARRGLIYVSNQGDGTLSVIDSVTNQSSLLAVGGSPAAVAVNPVTGMVYVVDVANARVAVIDGSSQQELTTVPCGAGPSAIVVNAVTNRLYVANTLAGTVTAIDGATNTPTTVTVGASPGVLAVNSITDSIYVPNAGDGTVTVIDGASNTTGSIPISAGAGAGIAAVNEITNRVYVANVTDRTVTMIDGAGGSTATISVGSAPTAVVVDAARNRIYVTNAGDNTVTVIDGTSNATSTVDVGTGPGAAAVNPETGRLYVANLGGGDVTVVTPALAAQGNLTTLITSLPGNETFSRTATFTLMAASLFGSDLPAAPPLYFQLDTTAGAWSAAVSQNLTGSATLSGLTPGWHTLFAFAADGEGATSINTGAGASPIVGQIKAYTFLVTGGSFFFEDSGVTAHSSGASVTVTVQRDFDDPATVAFQTVAGTALAGVNFIPVQGALFFAQGERSKTITVPLIAPVTSSPTLSFSIQLTSATVGMVPISGQSIVILNDLSAEIGLSLLQSNAPEPASTAAGSIMVLLSTQPAEGRWRLFGELAWRGSGDLATGLVVGNYNVEFKPVDGFVVPDMLVVPVGPGEQATASGNYTATTAAPVTGSLTVILSPAGKGAWRIQGGDFQSGGTTLPALSVGSYILEFQEVANRVTPPDREVIIQAGQQTAVTTTYLIPDAILGAAPVLVDEKLARTTAPYLFTGQIQTDNGFGTGFVPLDRVVVTAAHVLFDDGSLTFAPGARWYFQRERGVFEAPAQIPRGIYLFDGYAAQREMDNSPGTSTEDSQQLDVAAMYFLEPAARGGQSGYLASNSGANPWLTGLREKTIVGYPVEGVDASLVGHLFATPPLQSSLSFVSGALFYTTDFTSFPGNSGGPLGVQFDDGTFYPAAIYLGGTARTVVRAIDSQVIDLMNRAEVSGNGGANNVGGGILQASSGLSGTTLLALGSLGVTIMPAGARAVGARWSLDDNISRKSGSPALGLPSRSYTVKFSDIPGYTTPPARAVAVQIGAEAGTIGAYVPNAPPAITSPLEIIAILGQPLRYQLAATLDPTGYSVMPTLLPAGLSFNSSTGLLSGTPKALGPFALTLRAANVKGTSNPVTLHLTVAMPGELTVTVNPVGKGAVPKAFAKGTTEPVGSLISIGATPKAGYLFDSWTDAHSGQVLSTSPTYKFTMPEMLDLQVNFVLSPFVTAAGSYLGVLPGGSFGQSGFAQLAVTSSGSFTSTFRLGTANQKIRNVFNNQGHFGGQILFPDGRLFNVALDLTAGGTLSGKLTNVSDGSQITFGATRGNRRPAAALVGFYTAGLRPDGLDPLRLTGNGFGNIAISRTGAVSMTGFLGDGVAVKVSALLDSHGAWPFYFFRAATKTTGPEVVVGTLTANAPPARPGFTGTLDWFRDGQQSDPLFPDGFAAQIDFAAGGYLRDPATKHAVTYKTAVLTFAGGGFANPATKPISINAGEQVGFSMGDPSTMKFVDTSGRFSGTFLDAGQHSRSFNGVVLQSAGSGVGFFQEPDGTTGSVLLQMTQ